MTTRIKNDDETFIASKKNETFLVETDTDLVFLTSSIGIDGSDKAGGRTFRIDGSVEAAKDPATAIALECSAANSDRIIVGSTGSVTATFNAMVVDDGLVDIRVSGKVEGGFSGIVLTADKATLRNSGTIEGGTGHAVNLAAGTLTLENSGQLISSSGTALGVAGNCTVLNTGDIQVDGPSAASIIVSGGDFELRNTGDVLANNTNSIAIRILASAENAKILNEGTISGSDSAVAATTGASSDALIIVNTGEIIGDIDLSRSARNDVVNTSNGRVEGDILTGDGNDRILLVDAVVTGQVSGGEGDDTYTISSNTISLAEDVNAGTDTVRATGNVSIILADNLENVVLIGANDTQATGNSADNRMTGNDGNNVIEGANGEDTIRGGKGRDELIGGGDTDTFIFRKGDGKDLMGDFDTGGDHDFFDLSAIKGITDFDDLIDNHAKEVDGDVVLSFGNGDRIVIESKAIGELRAEMFFL